MSNTFDLRKFLQENKLTQASKYLTENQARYAKVVATKIDTGKEQDFTFGPYHITVDLSTLRTKITKELEQGGYEDIKIEFKSKPLPKELDEAEDEVEIDEPQEEPEVQAEPEDEEEEDFTEEEEEQIKNQRNKLQQIIQDELEYVYQENQSQVLNYRRPKFMTRKEVEDIINPVLEDDIMVYAYGDHLINEALSQFIEPILLKTKPKDLSGVQKYIDEFQRIFDRAFAGGDVRRDMVSYLSNIHKGQIT